MYQILRSLVSTIIAMAWLALPAYAAYPDRPITVIVPFASTESVFKVVTDGLSRELGVPVRVEVHAGPSGLVAMYDLLQAKPDGYTIGMGAGPNLIMTFYDKKPFDVSKVILLGMTVAFEPSVIAVSRSYTGSLEELVSKMRARGADFTWVSGTRTTAHMTGLQFMTAAHAKTTHQETKNANVSLSMLMGGPGSFIASAIERGAKIRPIAVLSNARHPDFPGVMTANEAGVDGAFTLLGANVLVAPPGTPPEVTTRLRDALFKTMHDPKVIAALRAQHFDAMQSPLADMESTAQRWLVHETAGWERVRKTYGINLQD
jgi:tripartite-type tricarboxylate transporter receptor subunit TctC